MTASTRPGIDVRRRSASRRAARPCPPGGPGGASPPRERASTSSEAATSASCRSPIGVVPAWLAAPTIVARKREMATMPSTTPIGTPLAVQRAALLDVKLEVRVEPRRAEAPRRSGPDRRRCAGRRRLRRSPFHTWSISPAISWPATAREPLRPFGKVPPSSCAQTTTSTGWRVATPARRDGARHLDGGERPQGAVEVAAVRDRVDVRADQDRTSTGWSSRRARRRCCRPGRCGARVRRRA